MNFAATAMRSIRRARSAALVVALLVPAGCSGIGPGTVIPSRFDYTAALGDSWKQQMLINAVKMRYGDPPVFLDVSSVISQFQIAGQVSWGGTFNQQTSGDPRSLQSTANLADPISGTVTWGNAFGTPYLSNTQTIGAFGNYADRPTITYVPLSGEKFTRTLMKPIPPMALMSLIEAGYPIDLVLRLCVHSINGVRNRYGGSARAHPADPEFYALVARLRRIQDSRVLGMRVVKTDEAAGVLMTFRKDEKAAIAEDTAFVRKTLGLDPNAVEFKVAYGSLAQNETEIAILTRSVLEIIIDISSSIEVPPEHVAERRVTPTMPDDTIEGAPVRPLISIKSSGFRPPDAYLAVPYRSHWYWIDDRDTQSKSLFAFLMMIFSLNDTEAQKGAPIITIPSG